MRLFQAIGFFFKYLFDASFASEVRQLTGATSGTPGSQAELPPVDGKASPKPAKQSTASAKAARSDAVSLLAMLQREARFVDIVMEPLADYSDQQVGAAARDVLKNCGEVLRRVFALQSVVDVAEGETFETPADVDPGCYRLMGNISGNPPYRGQIMHHGWRVERCELATWSGSASAAMIVAPVEVEVASS